MTFWKTMVIVGIVALFVGVGVPTSKAADDYRWRSVVTFSEPVQVSNLVLSPGTYLFRRSKSSVTQDVVAIYSVDNQRWEGFVSGIPTYKNNVSDTSSFVVRNDRGDYSSLHYWFTPGRNRGIEFIDRRSK